MKKHFASKALASVLVLLMAFGVTASAIDGDPPPAALDICVGQIVSIRQLVEDAGYSWPGTPYVNVQAASSGAVNCVKHGNDWHVLYGTAVGQGSVTVTLPGTQSLSVSFHVSAASDPVVMEASMTSTASLSPAALLADAGYTPADIDKLAYWDNKSTGGERLEILYGFSTHGNGTGKSQILLNMKDGRVILINVTIEDPPRDKWSEIREILVNPIMILFHPLFWPLILVSPIFVPVMWIMGFIGMATPTKYYDVTPVLAF